VGIDPDHTFSIGFDWNDVKQNAEEILNLPEKIAKSKGIKIVVCIDEFQNIAMFNESLAFQKLLRSVWQKHEETCYCLYGSKFHMMQELFERQSKPFYRFGDLIHLGKIGEKEWTAFIKDRFEITGKHITDGYISKIITDVDRQSYYVQQLSHLIWEKTDTKVTENVYQEALDDMISQNAILYQRDTEMMSSTQLHFLKAIASGVKQNLSGKDTVAMYKLGTSANVIKIKKNLLFDEIIDIQNKIVSFIDLVYELWKEKYCNPLLTFNFYIFLKYSLDICVVITDSAMTANQNLTGNIRQHENSTRKQILLSSWRRLRICTLFGPITQTTWA
jgi:hypothetical protein